jgi:hypothetical protein
MKVRAKNDDIRKVLKHPTGGAFREDGTAEWPDDSFTYRQITDGAVTAEEQQQPQEAAKKGAKKDG